MATDICVSERKILLNILLMSWRTHMHIISYVGFLLPNLMQRSHVAPKRFMKIICST